MKDLQGVPLRKGDEVMVRAVVEYVERDCAGVLVSGAYTAPIRTSEQVQILTALHQVGDRVTVFDRDGAFTIKAIVDREAWITNGEDSFIEPLGDLRRAPPTLSELLDCAKEAQA